MPRCPAGGAKQERGNAALPKNCSGPTKDHANYPVQWGNLNPVTPNISGNERNRKNANSSVTSDGFVDGFCSATGISLPAEFALGRRRARTLFAGSRLGPGEFLALARKTGIGHVPASAAGVFGATLAAVGLVFVGIPFTGPLILNHAATGAGGPRIGGFCR